MFKILPKVAPQSTVFNTGEIVYAVDKVVSHDKKQDVVTEFLIYEHGDWVWVDAKDFYPLGGQFQY